MPRMSLTHSFSSLTAAAATLNSFAGNVFFLSISSNCNAAERRGGSSRDTGIIVNGIRRVGGFLLRRPLHILNSKNRSKNRLSYYKLLVISVCLFLGTVTNLHAGTVFLSRLLHRPSRLCIRTVHYRLHAAHYGARNQIICFVYHTIITFAALCVSQVARRSSLTAEHLMKSFRQRIVLRSVRPSVRSGFISCVAADVDEADSEDSIRNNSPMFGNYILGSG